VCVCSLILTTGHLKDPTSCPEHGQTQHGVVEVDLIFGKSSFYPHDDAGTGALEAAENKP